jgi:hypothetical protein
LYAVLEVPLKVSVAPKIAVTTDAVLVEQEPSREMRRRLEERKPVPDELESKDAEGGAALGDPTSMRSWLSCLDIVEESFVVRRLTARREYFFSFSHLMIIRMDHIGGSQTVQVCQDSCTCCVKF